MRRAKKRFRSPIRRVSFSLMVIKQDAELRDAIESIQADFPKASYRTVEV
ncbi:MAG: hypothetical protein ACYDHM_13405 [Acidiferrobacterales bacterium]